MKHKLIALSVLLSCIYTAYAGTVSAGSVKIIPETSFTGRGNRCEELLTIRIGEKCTVKSIRARLDEDTFPGDIEMLYLIQENADGKVAVLGKARPSAKAVDLHLSRPYGQIEGKLKICADISHNAVEGHRIKAIVEAVRTGRGTIVPEQPDNPGREILLARTRLYSPGDYGSRNWRIPALRCLPDGSLLAVNDKRKYNETDLPEDIDIVARRSEDGGHTWSEPVDIAVGQGYRKGFGDPALAVSLDGKTIICAFVGGNGLWASTLEDPQRSYISRSTDGGRTWSTPEDITHIIYGPQADNPQCRNYTSSFFGSGNGLTLRRGEHAGRIMFVAAMCPASNLNNHAVYSDDGGNTWHVSDIAFEGGDEAKAVELSDGRILMSIRRSGQRGYSISHDGGETWTGHGLWPEIDTNACNGDMIRYSAVDEGGERNILLHSIPNSPERRNVSIFLSYDEGISWGSPKTICPGKSVYSSVTVLPDGTIGIYVEENPTEEGCSLWFMNFSLDWLTRP
ncbi:MAG: glycoside hydrolase [Bacteroidales bacterium]|nr:glycoside hydrolase [Bacteroidales bacterium]